jgi:ArsR family transcriptional regulator
MTELDKQRLTRRASILKSLAHPSRLLIIEMLEKAPRCVGELTEAIGADITTVSKHLAVMKRAGLVRDEKHGTYSEYSLVCDCVTHLIDCIEEGMGGTLPGATCGVGGITGSKLVANEGGEAR